MILYEDITSLSLSPYVHMTICTLSLMGGLLRMVQRGGIKVQCTNRYIAVKRAPAARVHVWTKGLLTTSSCIGRPTSLRRRFDERSPGAPLVSVSPVDNRLVM